VVLLVRRCGLLGAGFEIGTPLVLVDREGWLVVVDDLAAVAAAIEANDVEAGEYVCRR
jgi:hypothetical protein